MGRSVMVPGDAIATVYVHVEIEVFNEAFNRG